MSSSRVVHGGWRATLTVAVDACLADDPAALDDAQLADDLASLSRAVRRLEARRALLVAEQQRRRPARNPSEVTRSVKEALGVSGAEARHLAETAEALRALPPCAAEALGSGAMSGAHLRALHVVGASLPDAMKADLLTAAVGEDADLFRRRVQAAVMRADADDGAARVARQHAARTASWRECDDGMHELRALLAPDDGAIVRTALQQIMDRRWRAEHPDRAAVRVERDPYATRLADALVELAQRGVAGATADAVPLVSVLSDVETLQRGLHERSIHEDEWGSVLAPETLRRLACDAEVLPIVMDGASVPVDLGRRRRLPTAAQRAAVVARDRRCLFPGCTLPAAWCQIHHIDHWADGGPTDLSNLLLLCHQDHRRVHEGGWRIEGTAANPTFVSPSGERYRSGRADTGADSLTSVSTSGDELLAAGFLRVRETSARRCL